jgi:hypothetical protein
LVKIGLIILGAIGGASFGLFILGWKSGFVIESEAGRIIFIICFAIVGIILIHLLEKPAIIAASSILGSYVFFSGLDVFLKVGFVESTRSFLKGKLTVNRGLVEANPKLYVVLVCIPVLAIIGGIAQWRMNEGRDHRKNVV